MTLSRTSAAASQTLRRNERQSNRTKTASGSTCPKSCSKQRVVRAIRMDSRECCSAVTASDSSGRVFVLRGELRRQTAVERPFNDVWPSGPLAACPSSGKCRMSRGICSDFSVKSRSLGSLAALLRELWFYPAVLRSSHGDVHINLCRGDTVHTASAYKQHAVGLTPKQPAIDGEY